MNKRKKIILTVLSGGMSLAVLAAVLGLLSKGNLLFLVLFPLSGFLGYYAERLFSSRKGTVYEILGRQTCRTALA